MNFLWKFMIRTPCWMTCLENVPLIYMSWEEGRIHLAVIWHILFIKNNDIASAYHWIISRKEGFTWRWQLKMYLRTNVYHFWTNHWGKLMLNYQYQPQLTERWMLVNCPKKKVFMNEMEQINIDGQEQPGELYVHRPGTGVPKTWESRKGWARSPDTQIYQLGWKVEGNPHTDKQWARGSV